MNDRILRAPDTGRPLLDNDGQPIEELYVQQVDVDDDDTITVAELAEGRRSFQFGHVIVDEAQDLTPMQWRMVARRARAGSMTIVGDLAQRSTGAPGTWDEHLPASLGAVAHRELTVNYRSPAEVTGVASAILSELAPDLRAARAIRSSGQAPAAVRLSSLAELPMLVSEERASTTGRIAVIGHDLPDFDLPATTVLEPRGAKGLEFDTVVVVEPSRILAEPFGLSLLYVAVTRTTRRLVIAHCDELPDIIAAALG